MALPGLIGLALLVLFVLHERRSDHPMLPLELFRSRNFAVGNLATLLVYGGLGAATFFVAIYLQQVAGYSAVAAGLTLMPITRDHVRALAPLRRAVGSHRAAGADGRRPARRRPRAGLDGARWTPTSTTSRELLPGVLVFGLGLSMTVAPLTNTVLGAVPQHNAGVASGANNAISRIAGLLAIAAVGAVVASQFGAELDRRLAGRELSGQGAPPRSATVKERPLSGGVPRAPELDARSRPPPVHAYRWGLGVGGGLMMLGGVISLVGIVNPRRAATPQRREAHGPASELQCTLPGASPRGRGRARGAPTAASLPTAWPAVSRRSPRAPTSASPRWPSAR